MKILLAAFIGLALVGHSFARDPGNRITSQMQVEIDAQKQIIAQWAGNSAIVATVKAQNAKGPLPGMTNGKWRALDAGDPLVRSLQKNAAAQWLSSKIAASKGLYREAFLNAALGEKAAFIEKPSSYLHSGTPKFDRPMKGALWQGEPEWDKSSNSYVIQLAAPVLHGGKAIGVLVVGVSMKAIKEKTRP